MGMLRQCAAAGCELKTLGRFCIEHEASAAEGTALAGFYVAVGRLVSKAGRPSALRRQDGQALIEYALIVSLIAIVAIAALSTTGTNIRLLLDKVAGDV